MSHSFKQVKKLSKKKTKHDIISKVFVFPFIVTKMLGFTIIF